MSDTTDSSSYYTQSASLQKCALLLPDGQEHDLKDMVIELSYYEDIYSFSVSGYVMIRDGLGIIEKAMLRGSEQIIIGFDKFNNSVNYENVLIAYTIKDRKPTTMTSEVYKIHFCSVDLLNNQAMVVEKSYKGKTIDYMVKDILKNELQCQTKIGIIQPTLGTYDYIAPMTKPFETISELSNYARPASGSESGTVGADMFLFENRFGYMFASLNSLMSATPSATYRYEQSNLNDPDKLDKTMEMDSILALEYVRSYNTLREISNGAYANRVIGYNNLTGEKIVKDFDYLKYVSQVKPVNGNNVQPLFKNSQLNDYPQGYIRVVPTNSGENTVNYIKDKKAVTPDYYLQDTLGLRTSQLAMANHTVLKIVVPGSSLITVGTTVNVLIYSTEMSEADNSRELDKVYSGVYLITAVRHIIQSSGVFQSVLEIVKNSNMG